MWRLLSLGRSRGKRGQGRDATAVAPAAGDLTPDQIKLLLNCVKRVAATPDESGRIFYRHLFLIAPDARRLFPDDMAAQHRKLIQTLLWIVSNLHKRDEVTGALREMGCRHWVYRVEDEHYDKVGEALLYMIRDRIGADFTADVFLAWTAAYDVVAKVMKDAAGRAPKSGDFS